MEQANNEQPPQLSQHPKGSSAEVRESAEGNGAESRRPPPQSAPATAGPKAPIYQMRLTWLLAFATIALFALTVVYAFGSSELLDIPAIRLSLGHTILVLRLLSEVTGLCMASLIDGSLERLQWMLAARERGFALPGFLALACGTGKLGLLNILIRGFRGGKRWSVFRLILVLGVPVLGVVILSNVNAGLVFREYESFPVAAGLGDFDGSNVDQWKEIAALQITTDFKNLLQNSQLAVSVPSLVTDGSRCYDSDIFAGQKACGTAFFIHGGLQLVTPSPVKDKSNPNAYLYVVHSMQGMQLDFLPIASNSRFDGATDCLVAGNQDAAVQFYICEFVLPNRHVIAIIHWLDDSLMVHRRSADVYFSRYNLTTVSVRNLTPATAVKVAPSSLLHVFNTTFSGNALGFSSNTAGQQFIFFLSTYLATAATSNFGNFEAGNYLRNLLALPLYYFQPTYLSNASFAITESNADQPNPALPRELYTTAALADPSYQVNVAKWSALLYAIGGALIIAVCLVLLLLGSLPQAASKAPESTLWSVLDFVMSGDVMKEGKGNEGNGQTTGLRERLVGLKGIGLREEARRMGRITVVARV